MGNAAARTAETERALARLRAEHARQIDRFQDVLRRLGVTPEQVRDAVRRRFPVEAMRIDASIDSELAATRVRRPAPSRPLGITRGVRA